MNTVWRDLTSIRAWCAEMHTASAWLIMRNWKMNIRNTNKSNIERDSPLCGLAWNNTILLRDPGKHINKIEELWIAQNQSIKGAPYTRIAQEIIIKNMWPIRADGRMQSNVKTKRLRQMWVSENAVYIEWRVHEFNVQESCRLKTQYGQLLSASRVRGRAQQCAIAERKIQSRNGSCKEPGKIKISW